MKTLVTIALFLLHTSSSYLQAQTLPFEWKIVSDDKISWMEVSDWGILLLQTSSGIKGIDPINGETLWKLPQLLSSEQKNYLPLKGTPFIALRENSLYLVINSLNGEVILDSSKTGFGKVNHAQILPNQNRLLVEFEKNENVGLALHDITSNQTVWKKEFPKSSRKGEYQVRPLFDKHGDILYSIRSTLIKINSKSGEIAWDLEFPKLIRDVFFDSENQILVAVNGSISNKFLESKKGSSASAVSGNVGKFNISAYNFSDGTEIWSYDYKSKYGGSILSGKEITLLHAFSINFIEIESGKKKWKNEPKFVGGDLLSAMIVTEEGILYAVDGSTEDTYITFNYLDHEGNKLWKKRPITRSKLLILQWLENGALFVSQSGANILSKTTGRKSWEGLKYLSSDEQPFLISKDENQNVLLYNGNDIFRILTKKEDWEPLADNVQISNENATSFNKVKEGFLLSSSQNLILMSDLGKQIYHRYYPAPKLPFSSRLLLSLGGNLLDLAASQATYNSEVFNLMGELDSGSESEWKRNATQQRRKGSITSGLSDELSSFIDLRFTEEATLNDYKLILTQIDGVIGLIKLDTQNGQELGFIETNDRTPAFVLDKQNDMLYLQSKTNDIIAFKM